MAQIHNLETLKNGGYKGTGPTTLKLTCPLDSFPLEILQLGDTLTQLDLSGTGLSSLPSNFGSSLPNLKIAFFSNCNFTTFPPELSTCPNLEMIALRSNRMTSIPENSLPPNLRWLILTDNLLPSLPDSIGSCHRLQKCMLSGNLLTSLPLSLSSCLNLSLLRLSANKFQSLPSWLFKLPSLAFLSFAGNPCSTPSGTRTPFTLQHIPYSSLKIHSPPLGSGASGIISRASWEQSPSYSEEVAIKLFRGHLTSDGTPADEMAACIAAGNHESLITVLGKIDDFPHDHNEVGGIVMQLIPQEDYKVLGLPPSMESCTRDTFSDEIKGLKWDTGCVLAMLTGLAGAAGHLHQRGINHGDLYAHNVLAWKAGQHALLGDFGAATVYGTGKEEEYDGLEKLEVLAFGWLVEDMIGLLVDEEEEGPEEREMRKGLQSLKERCTVKNVEDRPSFEEIVEELEGMVGWRGMMRIPTIPN
ncbi:leucine-rich repeat-containing protein 28 [Podospora fimiseda]|uniref:Leucine-rich repeat-containing protein 28 n=1 Tax=Podospora fimiseda TaxID=252190 RepID=A0AAN7GTE9_9PEZI|nr:leucine-rich repeat-containing protein 28 [Podospora fimiseda]